MRTLKKNIYPLISLARNEKKMWSALRNRGPQFLMPKRRSLFSGPFWPAFRTAQVGVRVKVRVKGQGWELGRVYFSTLIPH